MQLKFRKFEIGDTVKVIGYRPPKDPPTEDEDELGTEKLFKSMVGRKFKIRGFDEYGHVELKPTRLDFVWIEPDLLELVAPAERKRVQK